MRYSVWNQCPTYLVRSDNSIIRIILHLKETLQTNLHFSLVISYSAHSRNLILVSSLQSVLTVSREVGAIQLISCSIYSFWLIGFQSVAFHARYPRFGDIVGLWDFLKNWPFRSRLVSFSKITVRRQTRIGLWGRRTSATNWARYLHWIPKASATKLNEIVWIEWFWWALRVLNPRPTRCKRAALPLS